MCRFPEIHLFETFSEFERVIQDADTKHEAFLRKSAERCGGQSSLNEPLSPGRWEKAAAEQCKVALALQAIAGEMEKVPCEVGSDDSTAAVVAQTAATFKSYAHCVLPPLRLVAHPYTDDSLLGLLVGFQLIPPAQGLKCSRLRSACSTRVAQWKENLES